MSLDALLPGMLRPTRDASAAGNAAQAPLQGEHAEVGGPGLLSGIALLLASVAGARPDLLRRARTVRAFYAALGAAVVLTAVSSGLSALLALGYALHEPLSRIWPIAVLWGLIILNLDRLMILTTVSRRRVGALLTRVLISVALGFLIAEPLALRVFERETQAVIMTRQNAAVAAERSAVLGDFAPQLQQLDRRLAGSGATLNGQEERADRLAQAADCERDGLGSTMPSCRGVSDLIGEGPRYRSLVADRNREEAKLRELHRLLDPQIAADTGARNDLLDQQKKRVASSVTSIDENDGLLARISALGSLQDGDPTVGAAVWLLRLVLVLLDLVPVIVKGLQVLDGPTTYDVIFSAEKEREEVEAHRIRSAAESERDRITRRKDRDDDIDEFLVDRERERVFSGAAAGGGAPQPGRPLRTASLEDVTDQMRSHERQPVAFHPLLRRAAWIGALLLLGLTLLLWLMAAESGSSPAGRGTALSVLGAAALLCWVSRGYQKGAPVVHVGAFASALAGLVLPLIVLVLNL